MKTVVFVAACLTLALAMPVQAYAENSAFSLHVRSGHFDNGQTYTLGPDETLTGARIEISLLSVVQLDGDVPGNLERKVGGGKKSPLSRGTILYSANDTQTTYCAKTWGNWNETHITPCLTDVDGDGQFDEGAQDRGWKDSSRHLAMVDIDGTLLRGGGPGGGPSEPMIAFPTPIAYHRLDGTQPPWIVAGIRAVSDYSKDRPGPVHFALAIWQSGRDMYGGLFSEIRNVTYDGSPVETDLLGIKLTVVGIDDKGNPLCKLAGQIDDQISSFQVQNIIAPSRLF